MYIHSLSLQKLATPSFGFSASQSLGQVTTASWLHVHDAASNTVPGGQRILASAGGSFGSVYCLYSEQGMLAFEITVYMLPL